MHGICDRQVNLVPGLRHPAAEPEGYWRDQIADPALRDCQVQVSHTMPHISRSCAQPFPAQKGVTAGGPAVMDKVEVTVLHQPPLV
jgi:hypothetical protein